MNLIFKFIFQLRRIGDFMRACLLDSDLSAWETRYRI